MFDKMPFGEREGGEKKRKEMEREIQ